MIFNPFSPFLKNFNLIFYSLLERALRALASSSGGAVCPGVGVRGQPRGSRGDPKVIPRRFKRKKIFVRKDGRTDVRTDGQTHVLVEIVC